MGRTGLRAKPYEYLSEPQQRRHGPAGYTDYDRYRPWLLDEFCFRCVYCLKRMVWSPTDVWVVDHLVSREEKPELECDYENLVLACQFCNGRKGPNRVPDPCRVAFGRCLRVEDDGTITPLNGHGRRLVSVLRLNHELQVQERSKVLRILSVMERHKRVEYNRLMGFPEHLPDLQRRKPPENRRPAGMSRGA